MKFQSDRCTGFQVGIFRIGPIGKGGRGLDNLYFKCTHQVKLRHSLFLLETARDSLFAIKTTGSFEIQFS